MFIKITNGFWFDTIYFLKYNVIKWIFGGLYEKIK